MALKLAYTLPFSNSVIAENAYHRIERIEGDKYNITYLVRIYYDEDSSKTNIAMNQASYTFKPDTSDTSKNFIEQAYINLKSLKQYSDSIDC